MKLRQRLGAGAPHLSVGVVSANWMALEADLRALDEAAVKLLHFDVMDGCFCPMSTLGAALVAKVRTPLLKDVHLMIDEPLPQLEAYVAAGADIVTIHVESTRHPHRALQALGRMKNVNDPARGIARGLALNPGTPLEVVAPLRDELDLVLLLGISPGWGGQQLVPTTGDRLRRLRDLVGDDVLVGVDGGITRQNASALAGTGVDIVVTGSAVFEGGAIRDNVRELQTSLRGP
ncbi:MAG TPA: ribulose-phosphate 3-epimerase [Lacunisphaera sp.]|jgi:ribulose-phosphate 3-epimerase|nr:ribulose-phosphate 3-epimerase [Lacunisphaera sp.]